MSAFARDTLARPIDFCALPQAVNIQLTLSELAILRFSLFGHREAKRARRRDSLLSDAAAKDVGERERGFNKRGISFSP